MAIKKLKLSKSLAARTAAIFVLVGMGGFAVWQSKSRQEETGGQDKEQTLVAAADSESSEVSQDAQTRTAVPSTSQEQNLEDYIFQEGHVYRRFRFLSVYICSLSMCD